MTGNWAYNLDLLAQNSVLDFDAASFVTGQAPRYVGAPSAPPSPYIGPPLPNAPALKQPEIDEFHQGNTNIPQKEEQNNDYVKNPSWKKWAFGALAVATLGLGIWKFKSVTQWVKNTFKKITLKSTKKFFVDKGKAVGKFFSKGWNRFTKLFKRKP